MTNPTTAAIQGDGTPESVVAKLRALDDEDICFTDIKPLLRKAADLIEALAAEIARLTILASRSELSAVAKALAWAGPYQCSLAGRVKWLIHDNDLIRENTKVVERQRDAALAKLEAIREVLEGLADVIEGDCGVDPCASSMAPAEHYLGLARKALSTEAASNFIVIPRDQPPAAHSPDAVE